jgi:hypothetical protein
VTGPNKHSRGAGEGGSSDPGGAGDVERRDRKSANRGTRIGEISTVVRILLLIWEVVRTLIDEHIFPSAGPGHLL